jgi:hypothetical protein
MSEPNREACLKGARMLIDRALDYLKAAGHLLKSSGVRDEECGLLIANAYLHARRALPEINELVKVFTDHEVEPTSTEKQAAS